MPTRAASPAAVPPPSRTERTLSKAVQTGLFWYAVSLALVVCGLVAGREWLAPSGDPHSGRGTIVDSMSAWDGQWYARIVDRGYDYTPGRDSSVNFFLGYPLAAICVRWLAGASSQASLLIVSLACLAVATVLFSSYAQRRLGDPRAANWAVAAFALWPSTFFFRMGYSEALFVLLTLAAMQAIRGRRDPLLVAAICGAATGVRSVGVALLVPLAAYVWQYESRTRARLVSLALCMAVGSWGLVGYMAYLESNFGDPLLFVKASQEWNDRQADSLGDKLFALATLEPYAGVYRSGSPLYWNRDTRGANPLLNLTFAGPPFVLCAAALVALGAMRGWLDRYEALLAAGLLGIPYMSRAYESSDSLARYAAVAWPVYLVAGRLLARMPPLARSALLVASAALLAIYSARFGMWYMLI